MQKLNGKHYKAIELILYSNLSNQEMAKEIGVDECTLSRWKNEPLFQEEMHRQMEKKFNRMAIAAQARTYELLNAESESVALSAAKDILDRAGFKPTDKTEISSQDAGIKISIDYGDSKTDENSNE